MKEKLFTYFYISIQKKYRNNIFFLNEKEYSLLYFKFCVIKSICNFNLYI